MKPILHNIPTNIITGFLGAGKTTAIRHLLQSKPAAEKWAVLVNEFGEVGIDGALLAADGIAVKEVPGGCMCCAAGLPSKVALNQLIREQRPDRLLIEPTGLAHPQQIVRLFSGPEYQSLLNLQTVVCLVDPWSVSDPRFQQLPAFRSQLELADRVVMSKDDVATEAQRQAFTELVQSLGLPMPPARISGGELPWQWLQQPHKPGLGKARQQSALSRLLPAHSSTGLSTTATDDLSTQAPATDTQAPATELVRRENRAEFGYSCGWRLPADWTFERDKLLAWLEQLELPRVKGLVHSDRGWLMVNRMRTTVSTEDCGDQAESRLEMIHTDAVDWNRIEQQLLNCLRENVSAGAPDFPG